MMMEKRLSREHPGMAINLHSMHPLNSITTAQVLSATAPERISANSLTNIVFVDSICHFGPFSPAPALLQ